MDIAQSHLSNHGKGSGVIYPATPPGRWIAQPEPTVGGKLPQARRRYRVSTDGPAQLFVMARGYTHRSHVFDRVSSSDKMPQKCAELVIVRSHCTTLHTKTPIVSKWRRFVVGWPRIFHSCFITRLCQEPLNVFKGTGIQRIPAYYNSSRHTNLS